MSFTQRRKMESFLKLILKRRTIRLSGVFLQQTLRMKGFSEKWCHWIQSFTEGGNANIKVNDQLGFYFQTKKGLRQADPLSPILFNIVVDMLAILIARAKADGQVEGVIPNLIEDGLSILQYPDDTIIFMSHDAQKAVNMKFLLSTFEQVSGFKINFHRVKYFALARQKTMKIFIRSCLDVLLVNILFVT